MLHRAAADMPGAPVRSRLFGLTPGARRRFVPRLLSVGYHKCMTSQARISSEELRSALAGLPGWELAGEKLHREYRFPDFIHAFGFMATAAVMIEALGHHPEWSNVYNRVTVDLTTHDAGGITAKDLELARKLEAIAGKLQ